MYTAPGRQLPSKADVPAQNFLETEMSDIQLGLYDDLAQEVVVAARPRHLILAVIEGSRGTSLSINDVDFELRSHLPGMMEAVVRDFLAGAYDGPSPYDAILREIHRTTRAKAAFMVIFQGVHGTHVSKVGTPDMIATFTPSFLTFLKIAANGIRILDPSATK